MVGVDDVRDFLLERRDVEGNETERKQGGQLQEHPDLVVRHLAYETAKLAESPPQTPARLITCCDLDWHHGARVLQSIKTGKRERLRTHNPLRHWQLTSDSTFQPHFLLMNCCAGEEDFKSCFLVALEVQPLGM